jgi:hypothetical protein
VPNRSYPPPSSVLAAADRVVSGIQDVTPELIGKLGDRGRDRSPGE